MPVFGDLLRRLRGSRTQREVAADLEMPITTLSTLEHQETLPRGPVLKRLADYYGVPITYFFPSPASEMKSSPAAKAWLQSIHKAEAQDTIATYAAAEFPEDLKRSVAEAIKQKKNG